MNSHKIYSIRAISLPATTSKSAVRTYLNTDTLLALVRKDFQLIPDARASNVKIRSTMH